MEVNTKLRDEFFKVIETQIKKMTLLKQRLISTD